MSPRVVLYIIPYIPLLRSLDYNSFRVRWGEVSLNCSEVRDEGFECRAYMLGFVGTGFRVGLGFKG